MKKTSVYLLCIILLASSFSAYARKHRRYDCNEKTAEAIKNYNLKKYSKVRSELEYAKIQCNGNPNMDTISFYLGMTYMKTKMYTEARNEFDRIVSDFPDSPLFFEAKFRSALAVYQTSHKSNRDQKETNEAITMFREMLELYPSSPLNDSVQYYLQRAIDKMAEKEINSARFYVKVDEYESAIIYFRSFIEDYPQSRYVDESRYTIALMQFKLDRKDEVKETLADLFQNGSNSEILAKAKELQKKLQ